MDVGGVVLDRFGEETVDQPDYRCVIFALQQVLGFRKLFGKGLEIEVFREILGTEAVLAGSFLICLLEQLAELFSRHFFYVQGLPGEASCFGKAQGFEPGTAVSPE